MGENKLYKQLDRIEQLTLLSAKNVLSFDDVILLTGFSKSHLYKLTCGQLIPHYKPNGKQIYFDKIELESWLKRNKVKTKDEVEEDALAYLIGSKKKGAKI